MRFQWNLGVISVLGALFALVVGACGGTDNVLTDAGMDGDPFGDGGGDAGQCLMGQTACNGICLDTKTDPKNCGACGTVCTGCQQCAGGACTCPLYQSLCNGKCIPTSSDPDNCGACGKTCTVSEVCSGSKCVSVASGCIPPPSGGGTAALVPCSGRCVDPLNDNAHCGGCGKPCAANTGCVDGQCVAVLPVGASPVKCECGGPPIQNGKDCLGNIAQTTFRWALCSCGDVSLASQLFTDSYDSTKGPYPPNPKEYSGGVGLNGAYTGPVSNPVEVGGALWSSGASVATRSPTDVRREAHIAGTLTATVDPLTIFEDAYVGGNVTGTSSITMKKTLYISPNASVNGNVTFVSKVQQAINVAEPCDCGPKRLPIATWVAAAAATNDNAAITLDANVLATPGGGTRLRLDLPCGIYYLTKINKPGSSVTINAKGRTALFIDGDVVGQIVSFVLDPNAEFDVFIKGSITAGGELVIGSPNHPALSRTYVGGAQTLLLSGEAGRLGGNLYAAYAPVNVTSHVALYGGIYAGSFSSVEQTDIHYDRDITRVGRDCPPPPPMCGDCKDCNNQACINGKCDMCTNSSQCCPPLVCVNGGCVPQGPN